MSSSMSNSIRFQRLNTLREVEPVRQPAAQENKKLRIKTGDATKIARANAARGAAQALGAANLKPAVETALPDPLNRSGNGAADANAARHVDGLNQRFGRLGGGQDEASLIDGPVNRIGRNRDPLGVPGLRPDIASVPGVSASQGGTQPGDTPDPVIDKQIVRNSDGSNMVIRVYDDGSTSTVTRWKDGEGRHTGSTTVDPDGRYDHVDSVQRRDGSSETVWTSPHRTDVFWRTADGRHLHMALPRGGLARTLTGEEAAGGGWWCPPSGWGCGAPKVATAVDGGRRERPSSEGPSTPASGPTIDLGDLAGNPNPDVYARGGGAGPSARSFDGGKLVNPVGCARGAC
jgi:hypothetical protein